jgi:hypothetical protein
LHPEEFLLQNKAAAVKVLSEVPALLIKTVLHMAEVAQASRSYQVLELQALAQAAQLGLFGDKEELIPE